METFLLHFDNFLDGKLEKINKRILSLSLSTSLSFFDLYTALVL